MTSVPPKRKPGSTLPPPDDFDEDAPTSVVPGKAPLPQQREFDEGGELDESEDEETTGARKKIPADGADEDEAPTRD
jgi:hypothetical protein